MVVQKRENDLVLGDVRPRLLRARRLQRAARGHRAVARAGSRALPAAPAYQYDELGQQDGGVGQHATPNPPYRRDVHVLTSGRASPAISCSTMSDEGGHDLCRMDVPTTRRACIASPGTCASRSRQQAGGGRGGGGRTRRRRWQPACQRDCSRRRPREAPAPRRPPAGGARARRVRRRWIRRPRRRRAARCRVGRYTATLGKIGRRQRDARSASRRRSSGRCRCRRRNW